MLSVCIDIVSRCFGLLFLCTYYFFLTSGDVSACLFCFASDSLIFLAVASSISFIASLTLMSFSVVFAILFSKRISCSDCWLDFPLELVELVFSPPDFCVLFVFSATFVEFVSDFFVLSVSFFLCL